MKSNDEWIYSTNEEIFWENSKVFNTKEEVIEFAKQDKDRDSQTIFIGKRMPGSFCNIDAERILEEVARNTSQSCEYADNFLEGIDNEHYEELEDKLNDVFLEWMNKYNYEPTWFEVVDIEEIQL